MDDLVIRCDEIIESYNETKTIPTNFNEEKTTCKTQKIFVLLPHLLLTLALLIPVSIYCHFIKCRAKPRHLLREVLY